MTGPTPGNADDTFVLDHPILGSMTGLVSADTPDVVRFRAIPYATLPGRLKQSILRESLDGLSGDFTKPGKACPHSFEMDDVNSGGRYPGQETIEASESECLILEINVPKSQLEAMKKKSDARIPVMTYIHGGAFVLGKIDAQHNTAPMAQHSLTILKPVITTSIQYRLGALGFIATPNGEKNFGLKDQRNALLWIQKFIDGFGGDKHRVTLFGESAGGYSICCHMLSHAPSSGPLFSRVIIMSGVMGPMMTPIAEDKAAKAFGKICESLAIEEGGEPALEKLRALDLQKLIAASDTWYGMLGNSWSPVQDPSFFRAKITWDNVHELLAKCEWVEDIVVGNTGFEGQAHLGVANVLTPKSFHEHLRLGLSDGAAQQVMQAYNVTPDMDQNLFLTPAMRWSSDVVFDVPIHAFAKHIAADSRKRLYRYIFDVRNPFPNAPFYQQSHHWVDVYFIFRTMQFRFPHQYLKDLSDKHAELWIDFANGKQPWSPYGDGIIMVADEREGWVEKSLEECQRLSRTDFGRMDKLWEVWQEKKGEMWLPLDMVALKESLKQK